VDKVYHKVGQPIPDDRPSIFQLVVEDIVDNVKPKKYGISSEKGIDPNYYFVTSGDAVEKAKVLSKEMWQYAGQVRKRLLEILAKENNCTTAKAQAMYQKGKRPKKPKQLGDFEAAVWKAAGQSRKLVNALVKAKGDDCFLETEWDSHKLLCIPKNPRSKE
jgi:hypothetical protein